MAESSLEDVRRIRLEKADKLRKLGINPYPSDSFKEQNNLKILEDFSNFNDKEVKIAGRLMSWRGHGSLIFSHVQDASGSLQLFIKKDSLMPTSKKNQNIGFSDLNLLDIGDFVEVSGIVTKTIHGEISVIPKTIHILAKSLRPLPEKWQGLKDPEIIFRKRYLDLVMSSAKRDLFIRKSKFWQANRNFLQENGFLEVETPILEHFTGGADAKPFLTHHNALDEDFYLRISTELFQKRLIGGGFEKIFTLGPNFRNEGIDDEHLQEYYQVEWYWAYADYKKNMELVRDLFRYVAKTVYGKTKFTHGLQTFDLADEWLEIDYCKIIQEKLGVDIFKDSSEKMLKVIKEKNIEIGGVINKSRIIDNLWKLIRKDITGPAFLVNEPKFMSPLAKSKTDNPFLTERFHVIIAGSELGNGYSELNDPIDQYQRFLEQQNAREKGDEEAQMLDIDYVEMLEYGMPPTSGYGQSERVFWFLEGLSAREATLFPQMKRKIDESNLKIYPELFKK